MSSSPEPTTPGILRGAAADEAVSARFDTNLARAGSRRSWSPSVDAELDAARAGAKAAGYAAGWATGRRTAKTQAAAAIREVEAASQRFTQQRAASLQGALASLAAAAGALERRAIPTAADLEDELVSAAFLLAEAVLGRELALSDSPGRDAVARALALAPVGRPVLIRVSLTDYATLTGSSTTGLLPSGATPEPGSAPEPLDIDGRTVTLTPDPALASGDAVVECDATVVDGRLSAALLRVGEALGLVGSVDSPW